MDDESFKSMPINLFKEKSEDLNSESCLIKIDEHITENDLPLSNDNWKIVHTPPISIESISQHFVHGIYTFISKFSRKEKLDIQRRIQKAGIQKANSNYFLPQFGIFLGENGIVPILWNN